MISRKAIPDYLFSRIGFPLPLRRKFPSLLMSYELLLYRVHLFEAASSSAKTLAFFRLLF